MPFHVRVYLTAAVGLLLLAPLYSGQTLQAQRPNDAYYERSGMWCGLYDIDPGRARLAVLAAMANMHMLIGQEMFFPYGSFIDTKLDNFEARITIEALGRPGTQIGVRITGFGTHRQVCARILDEVGRNMDAARRAPPPPSLPPAPAPPPAPFEEPAPAPVPNDRPSAGIELQPEIDQQLQHLSDANEGVRIDAVTQLGRMRAIQAIDPLAATLAGDQSPAVREAAAHSLGLIASPKALPALNRAIQIDPDHDVRKAAEFALEVIQFREQ